MMLGSKVSAWVKSAVKRSLYGPILEIPAEDYVETVKRLADWHLGPVARMVEVEIDSAPQNYIGDLLRALGCRYINVTKNRIYDPYIPPIEHEAVVRATLLRTLKSNFETGGYHRDAISLLDGLLRNNYWRDCLESTDSALNFAMLLIAFTRQYQPNEAGASSDAKLRGVILPQLCQMLNEWMAPDEPFEDIISPRQMAGMLFGEVWCELFLGDEKQSWVIGNLVGAHKPPLAPGLLPAHLQAQPEDLPVLFSC
jgi:hypothetical protein